MSELTLPTFQEVVPDLGDIYWHKADDKGYWSIIKPLGLSDTNYVQNPSFEFDTTGWVESVTATLTRGAGGTHGGYRAQLTGVGPGVFDVQYLTSGLSIFPGATLYGSIDIFAHSDTQVTVTFARHPVDSLATDCTVNYTRQTFTGKERWIRVYFSAQARSDGTTPAHVSVLIEATPITNNVTTSIFLDALKVSNYETFSYFDGDSEGAVWDNGNPHSSTSSIDQFQRYYGREYNFNENGWHFIADEGSGMPTIDVNTQAYAQGQGSHLNFTRATERILTLTFQADFDDRVAFDEAFASLEAALTYAYEDQCVQELILKYQIYDECNEEVTNALLIPVSYADGLQLIRKTPGSGKVAIQFKAEEQPFFETVFDFTNVKTFDGSGTAQTISRSNVGTVSSPLTIELRPTPGAGGATITSIKNTLTGHQIIFQNANGSTPLNFVSNLLLGTNPRRAYFVRAQNRTSIMDLIDYSQSDLSLMRAIPGRNFFEIVATNCDVVIRWKPRYKSTANVSCVLGP